MPSTFQKNWPASNLLILSMDGQGSNKGQGNVHINSEIPKDQHIILRSARITYGSGGYSANPFVYVSFSWLSAQQLNSNLPKAMIPIATSQGQDATVNTVYEFTIGSRIPKSFSYTFYDENCNILQNITRIIMVFEYHSDSIN